MKIIELIPEMAKSKNKRKRSAKLARKKKANNPTMDDQSNPVAKYAQQSGAGAHKDDSKYSKAERNTSKRQLKQELDN